jgi:hypothetical protein
VDADPFPLIELVGDVLVVTGRSALPGTSQFHTYARSVTGARTVLWAGTSHREDGALREHAKGRAWAAQHILLRWIQGREPGDEHDLTLALRELGQRSVHLHELREMTDAHGSAWVRSALEARLADLDATG